MGRHKIIYNWPQPTSYKHRPPILFLNELKAREPQFRGESTFICRMRAIEACDLLIISRGESIR